MALTHEKKVRYLYPLSCLCVGTEYELDLKSKARKRLRVQIPPQALDNIIWFNPSQYMLFKIKCFYHFFH